MFGLVTRKEFERERERALRAEAEAAALRGELADLRRASETAAARLVALLEGERDRADRLLAEERKRAERDRADLLDRLAPKTGFFMPQGEESASAFSPEDIRLIPALGKQDMRRREFQARAVERKEHRDEQKREQKERRATLSEAERAELKRTMHASVVGHFDTEEEEVDS